MPEKHDPVLLSDLIQTVISKRFDVSCEVEANILVRSLDVNGNFYADFAVLFEFFGRVLRSGVSFRGK